MNKPIRVDEPTQPVSTVTRLKYKLMEAQHKDSTTGRFLRRFPKVTRFLHGFPEATGKFFRKFRKPLIIGATSLALASGAVTAVSLTSSGIITPSKDEIQLRQVESAKVTQQLLDSSKNWDVRRFKDALQKGASIDSHSQDELGETPLIIVSRTGKIGRMKFLLNNGANPNAQDIAGWSALIGVSRNGNFEAAKLLLESGADPNLSNNVKETALFWAVAGGHNKLAMHLVKKGANVDTANVYGITPLMRAAAKGHIELCLLLLSAGAEINKHDMQGKTAMDYASTEKFGKQRKARSLLKAYGGKKSGN